MEKTHTHTSCQSDGMHSQVDAGMTPTAALDSVWVSVERLSSILTLTLKLEGAHLDIVASGFWGGRYERAYFDVRVFIPFTLSNRHSPAACRK